MDAHSNLLPIVKSMVGESRKKGQEQDSESYGKNGDLAVLVDLLKDAEYGMSNRLQVIEEKNRAIEEKIKAFEHAK